MSHASGLSARQPPDHTRLRGFIKKAFTPRRIAALEPQVRALTVEAIDAFAANGRADLVADLARDLPALVIFRLLGVPDADVPRVKEWALSRVYLNFGDIGVDEQVKHAQGARRVLALLPRPRRPQLRAPRRRPPRRPRAHLPRGRPQPHPRGDRGPRPHAAVRRARDDLVAARRGPGGAAPAARTLGCPPRRSDADPDRGRGNAAARHAGVRVEARHEVPRPRRRHRPPGGREPAAAARLREPRRRRLRRPRRDRPPPRERPQAPRVRARHPLLPRRRARALGSADRARRADGTPARSADGPAGTALHAQHDLPRPRVAAGRMGPGDRAARRLPRRRARRRQGHRPRRTDGSRTAGARRLRDHDRRPRARDRAPRTARSATTCRSRCARAPPPRTRATRASPASTTRSCGSSARTRCWKRCTIAGPA